MHLADPRSGALLPVLVAALAFAQESTPIAEAPPAVAEAPPAVAEAPPVVAEAPPAVESAPATEATPPPAPVFSADLLGDLQWRELGPVNMGGRVVDLAVDPRRASTFFVAVATGGIWKTVNNGSTFTPVFDRFSTASIGDVAVAPSDGNVVWVGTGEANPRNSVVAGAGVFKSTDGGATFAFMGLEQTRHVGRIAIHPGDPNVVFVAAAGRTWGPNEERGLYRTLDGGATWERVLFVDAQTGCIDVTIDPADPSIVLVATWQRQRDEFDGGDPMIQIGPGSGLWRSVDGGATFARCTEGLPTVPMGRIGLDSWAKGEGVVFAIIQTELTGKRAPGVSESEGGPAWLGVRGEPGDQGFAVTEAIERGPAQKAGIEAGDVIVRIGDDVVTSFESLRKSLESRSAGDEAEVTLRRGDQDLTLTVAFGSRPGASNSFGGQQGGQNPNAQDRQGGLGFETGGVFRSNDHGATWARVNSLNPRPFYYSQVRVDPSDASRLYVLGIAMHDSSDGGATFGSQAGEGAHPDNHALWIDPRDPDHLLLGNDGGLYVTWDRCKTWQMIDELPIGQFYNVSASMEQPYSVYGGLQDNGSWGGPSATRRRSGVPRDFWINVNGGDGFHTAVDPDDPDVVYSESQNGVLSRLDLRTGSRRGIRPNGDRFNWNTPFLFSPTNSATLWAAGEEVFRSVDRGDHWVSVSPEITRTDRGSATALAESPRVPGVVYVGTDDGALWLTRDGGRQWESLIERLPLPGPRYVADLECSSYDDATVFVAFDGHRSDDDAAWVFRSADFGQTWTRLGADLPAVPVRCIAESPRRRDLLFVGNDAGCFASIDGGERFARVANDLPTVPVFDLVIHPREQDLIAATHGRGLWILDVAPLEHFTPSVLARELELLPPADVALSSSVPDSTGYARVGFHGENPRDGVSLWYWLREPRGEEIELQVKNVAGSVVRRLSGPGAAGLHRVQWDLSLDVGGPGGRRVRNASVQPGDYLVVLQAGEASASQTLRIGADPAERGLDVIGERRGRR